MASWTWIVCSFTSKDKSGWLWITNQLILSMRNCWLRNSLGNTGWKLHDSLFQFMGICETAWACTFWSTPLWPFPWCAVRPVYLTDTIHLNYIYIYNCKFPTIVSNKILHCSKPTPTRISITSSIIISGFFRMYLLCFW